MYNRNGDNKLITSNLHYNGYGAAHRFHNVGFFKVENPYEEFNTYGVEWNENEYIFYLNGMEYGRSDFGGVCQNPLFLILSVEMYGENGVPSSRDKNADEAQFIVDYVRAYQYKDLLNTK